MLNTLKSVCHMIKIMTAVIYCSQNKKKYSCMIISRTVIQSPFNLKANPNCSVLLYQQIFEFLFMTLSLYLKIDPFCGWNTFKNESPCQAILPLPLPLQCVQSSVVCESL